MSDKNNNSKDIDVKKNRIKDINSINAIDSVDSIEVSKEPKKGTINPFTISLAIIAIAIVAAFIILKVKKPEFFSFMNSNKTKDAGKNSLNTLPTDDKIDNKYLSSSNVKLKKGIESYLKGYFTDAINEFNGVVESGATDKDKAIALKYLGMIAYDRKQYNKAIEFYNRAIKYDSKYPQLYKNLAKAYRKNNEYSKALQAIEKAISLNSDATVPHMLKGNILYDIGKYKEAVSAYKTALKLKPNNPSLLYNLALSFLKAGDEFAAIEYLKKAGGLDTSGEVTFRAYSRLGIIFTEKLQFNHAEQYLLQAKRLRPKNSLIAYNLGIAYLKQKKQDLALKEFSDALKYSSKDKNMLEYLGEAFFTAKDYDNSLKAYNIILKDNKRNIKLLSRVAEIYYEKKEYDKAYSMYENITTLAPATENARLAYINMGNILDDTGKYSDAIEAYKKALIINDKDDVALYNLGIVYKHANSLDDAIKAWDRAAKLNSKNQRPLIAIANLYYEKNMLDLAQRSYQKLAYRWPQNQELLFKLGTVYYKRGNYKQAAAQYDKVLQINKSSSFARKAMINKATIIAKSKSDETSLATSLNLVQQALLLKPGDAETLYALGTIYAKRNLFDKTIDTMYQVVKATRNNKLLAEAYNHIGKSYYKKQQYRKALKAFTLGIEHDPSNETMRLNRRTTAKAYETSLKE